MYYLFIRFYKDHFASFITDTWRALYKISRACYVLPHHFLLSSISYALHIGLDERRSRHYGKSQETSSSRSEWKAPEALKKGRVWCGPLWLLGPPIITTISNRSYTVAIRTLFFLGKNETGTVLCRRRRQFVVLGGSLLHCHSSQIAKAPLDCV